MKNGRRIISYCRFVFGLMACFYSALVFADCGAYIDQCKTVQGTVTIIKPFQFYGVSQGSVCDQAIIKKTSTDSWGTTSSVTCGIFQQGQCPSGTVLNSSKTACVPDCLPDEEKIDGKCLKKCPDPLVRDPKSLLCVDKCLSTQGKTLNLTNAYSPGKAAANNPVCYGNCTYSPKPPVLQAILCGDVVIGGGNPSSCTTYYMPGATAVGTGVTCSTASNGGGFTIIMDTPNSDVPVDRSDASKGSTTTDSNGSQTGNPNSGNIGTTTPTLPPKSDPNTVADCLAIGQGYGVVNGAIVCNGLSLDQTLTKAPETSTETKTNPDGSKTTTDKTTTTTITGDGKVKTETETKTTTTGGGGGTSTSTDKNETVQDRQSFCKENPNLLICKESTISGSCDAFNCSGDAIQCEIAKLAWKNNCDLNKETKFTKSGNDATSGKTETENKDALKKGLDKTLSPSSFDQQSFLSGGCLKDKTFSAAGRTFTIPFSDLCQYFDIIGKIVMALAFISSLKIVFGKE